MTLGAEELLSDERIVLTKRTNAVIQPTDYGLGQFPFDQYFDLVGLKGRESIGGKLHLTTARLVFKSHPINRVTGTFSIFLPTIASATDASFGINRKVAIHTESQQYEFVLWGIDAFVKALSTQQATLTDTASRDLWESVSAHPEVIGNGLQVSEVVSTLVTRLARGEQVLADLVKIAQVVSDPLGALSSLLNLLDLICGMEAKHGEPRAGEGGVLPRSSMSPVLSDLPSQLARLRDLHADGTLSDEEFETAKRRVLGDER
jgi:hypothetical protein